MDCRCMKFVKSLRKDQRGAVVIMVALAINVLIVACGLAADVAILYYTRQSMQNAADAAVLSATRAYAAGNTTGYQTEGRGNAGVAGWVNGSNGVTVTVVTPPTQGAYIGKANYFEAAVSQAITPTFMGLVMPSGWSTTVLARAVATASGSGSGAGQECMLSLTNVIINSGVNINLGSCGMAADATGSQAVLFNSGGKFTGSDISTPGGIWVNSGATVTATQRPGTTAVVNPYSGLTYSQPSCVNWSGTATAGTCYQNMNLSGTVSFPAGTYYISGDMNFNSGARVSGTGVTFILLGNLNINSGVQVNFSAPSAAAFSGVSTNYNYAGVVFFKPGSGNININSGSSSSLNGAVYAPQASVDFDSGSTVSQCNQIIGYSLTFNSGGAYGNSCSTTAIRSMTNGTGTVSVSLVQ